MFLFTLPVVNDAQFTKKIFYRYQIPQIFHSSPRSILLNVLSTSSFFCKIACEFAGLSHFREPQNTPLALL